MQLMQEPITAAAAAKKLVSVCILFALNMKVCSHASAIAESCPSQTHERLLQRAGFAASLADNVLDVERHEGSELLPLGVVR